MSQPFRGVIRRQDGPQGLDMSNLGPMVDPPSQQQVGAMFHMAPVTDESNARLLNDNPNGQPGHYSLPSAHWTLMILGILLTLAMFGMFIYVTVETNRIATRVGAETASVSSALSDVQEGFTQLGTQISSIAAGGAPSAGASSLSWWAEWCGLQLLSSTFSNNIGAPITGKIGIGIGVGAKQINSYLTQVVTSNARASWPYYWLNNVHFNTPNFASGIPLPNSDLLGNLIAGGVFPTTTQVTYISADIAMLPTSVAAIYINGATGAAGQLWFRALAAIGTGQNPYGVDPNYISNLTLGLNTFCAWAAQQPQVFLIIFEEFDFPISQWGGSMTGGNISYVQSFIQGFQAVAKIVHAQTDNVAMVWSALGAYWPNVGQDFTGVYNSTDPNHYNLWYPGDQYVDWISSSHFLVNASYQIQGLYQGQHTRQAIYAFARLHKKPVMFTEQYAVSIYSAPTLNGGVPFIDVFQAIHVPGYGNSYTRNTTYQEIWNYYFTPLFTELKANNDVIKMFLWSNIHSDNPSPVNNTASTSNGFGSVTLQENPYLAQLFFQEVSNTQYYFQMPRATNSAALSGTGVASVKASDATATDYTTPQSDMYTPTLMQQCWDPVTLAYDNCS